MPQRLERPGGDEAAPREEVWQLLAIREEMVALVPAIIFQRLTGKRLGEAEHRRSQGNGYHHRIWNHGDRRIGVLGRHVRCSSDYGHVFSCASNHADALTESTHKGR